MARALRLEFEDALYHLCARGMAMTAQAPNTLYTAYTSSSFTLSAGTYTLTIQGLNPNGGDNTMFIDAVKLNGTLVPNGGFETPAVGSGYSYNPTGASWSFVSGSGVAGNDSAFTSGNPTAPEGTQVTFIQSSGYASQSLTLASGSYTLTFYGAQRGNYNATYQKVQVSVQAATQIASTKQFVWIGNRIAEERDANNNVLRRFYPQGEQISGTSYFYTRDHLGSIRELTDSTAAIRARYDYDPYGYRTKVSGDLDAEFGYTGHYNHQPSGLNLALYRAYDAGTGRWISRDWIAEAGGINLYDYVLNSPLNRYDPFGLQGQQGEDTPDPLMGGDGTLRGQNQIQDIGNFASQGAGIAYPDNGKGFFETPSIWCKIKATLKWLFYGNEILNKYDPKCKDCDKDNKDSK